MKRFCLYWWPVIARAWTDTKASQKFGPGKIVVAFLIIAIGSGIWASLKTDVEAYDKFRWWLVLFGIEVVIFLLAFFSKVLAIPPLLAEEVASKTDLQMIELRKQYENVQSSIVETKDEIAKLRSERDGTPDKLKVATNLFMELKMVQALASQVNIEAIGPELIKDFDSLLDHFKNFIKTHGESHQYGEFMGKVLGKFDRTKTGNQLGDHVRGLILLIKSQLEILQHIWQRPSGNVSV